MYNVTERKPYQIFILEQITQGNKIILSETINFSQFVFYSFDEIILEIKVVYNLISSIFNLIIFTHTLIKIEIIKNTSGWTEYVLPYTSRFSVTNRANCETKNI